MGRDKLFGKRLKEARAIAGLSQKQLGIRAGLDLFVASPRVNRYERCVHTPPDIETAEKLADVLNVPAAYFFARDDTLAEMILHFYRLTTQEKDAVLNMVKSRRILEDPIQEQKI